MRIAFVGIEKDWDRLERDNYVLEFVKYHLELPWYYAELGSNQITIVTDHEGGRFKFLDPMADISIMKPGRYLSQKDGYDVVVHWRKWFEDLYRPEAINVINSQDHSYSPEWLAAVDRATTEGKLYGVLCFPTWHERRLNEEFSRMSSPPTLIPGLTLGVDTEIYTPKEKNVFDMLWASDPGRGLYGAIEIALELFHRDRRFKLHVCWPDYSNHNLMVKHPAIVNHTHLKNGQELWDLFNTCGFLPYTSTFMEPSSRCHRQAMAAGCVVLYPPKMGTPSELLTNGSDGIVISTDDWVDLIDHYANGSVNNFEFISKNAREHALRENWKVQALRFNKKFEEILEDD